MIQIEIRLIEMWHIEYPLFVCCTK